MNTTSVSPTLEHVPCPCCSADEPVLWAEEEGYSVQRCGACRFLYVSPRPSLDTIDEAAQTGLHETERGYHNAVSMSGFNVRKARLFEQRLRTLYPDDELAERPLRWLDVGCGFGELVAAVGEMAHPNSEVRGIDPCVPKVKVARQRGLNVTADTLDDVGTGYDVISLINVFSHLPDPTAFLSQLRDALSPEGELLLVTGNAADLEASEYPDPLLVPDHLVFAGERHLLDITRRIGFNPIAIERYPHFYRDPLWLYAPKAAVKRVLGRPVTAWSNRGEFRSIFVRVKRSAVTP